MNPAVITIATGFVFLKPLKKCHDFRTFSNFEYLMLISIFQLIMEKPILTNRLRPLSSKKKGGMRGRVKHSKLIFSKVSFC